LKFTIGNDVSCVTGKESGHLDVEAWWRLYGWPSESWKPWSEASYISS
jgi:hypothetical protein